jgi:signal transduction histidine kinase
MLYIFKNFIKRNFKRIPYFFEKEKFLYIEQQNYALIGKLSSSILHAILTPLTSILLLNQSKIDNKEKLITDSTQELKEYVDVLRNFTYQNVLDKKILVNSEISKCILLLKHKSISNNIQIQYIEYNRVFAHIHPLHIYQIVVNLVSNAIDASVGSQTQKIIVSLKKDEKGFEIICKDFGEGIPKYILKSAGKSITSTKSSTRGFGLYSVYYVVEKILKGSILIHSKQKEGTCVICKIPF